MKTIRISKQEEAELVNAICGEIAERKQRIERQAKLQAYGFDYTETVEKDNEKIRNLENLIKKILS